MVVHKRVHGDTSILTQTASLLAVAIDAVSKMPVATSV
jgi:hypothetical protein